MGPMYEIINLVKTIGSAAKLGSAAIFSSKSRSISAKAMDGTCIFPLIVDCETIHLDDALIIARAWERTCASFVLTTLTMCPFLHVEKGNIPTAAEYVKQFHVNFSSQGGYGNSYVGANLENFDKQCEELGINYHVLESSAAIAAVHIFQGIKSYLAEQQLQLENFVVEDYLNPFTINELSIVTESRRGYRANRDGSRDLNNKGNPKIFNDRRTLDHRIDANFQKANDLVPTMLHMRIYPLIDGTNGGGEAFDFVIGVKCQLHPVTTNQMVTEIARGIKNNDTLFNFIKWTTGEMKFFRDFIFAVDQQKTDALQSVRGDNASLVVASKRRKNLANVWNRFADNPLTPILSILVSNEDMEILRNEFGYDVEKMPTLINTLMNNFYLLGFMKLNNASERVDILIDGQQNPQTYLLNTLAKENTTDDRKFKEIMKMVGRRL